ncbi:radical SAM protein [Paenibacillus oralis]|uniref:Radical SAM protein n=1 Tax=Paenibacillus oralis TaxID=2490856 RepID=A0A3P3U181_9BACL|nr:radical SAM protein [Paenibacillus oralis]RRJ64097.1 radical SAM protein [Paenibacillus oralis]
MYFRLSSLVYLTKGCNSSLYDMKNNKIVLLDQAASQFIGHCEANNEIEAYPDYQMFQERIHLLLNQLEDWGMGKYYAAKTHIEKYRFNMPATMKGFNTPVPYFVRVYLELGGVCIQDCSFCDSASYSNWMGCRSCVGSKTGSPAGNMDYEAIIDVLRNLEVKELILRGGSPLLEWETLNRIAAYAAKVYEPLALTVITNGTEASFEQIKTMYEAYPGFKLNIVLFGVESVSSCADSGTEELIAAQCRLLDRLSEAKLPVAITLQLTGMNRDGAEEMIGAIGARWGIKPMVSEVVASDGREQLTHIKGDAKPIARYKYEQEFFMRQQYNTCLYGVFSIDSLGNVTSCPEIREIIGNIREEGIMSVLSKDRLYDFWEMTKNKVSHCRNCSMKYFCSDCSVFEVEANERDGLHQAYCSVAAASDSAASIMATDFKADDFITRLYL